ncbi:hypothetical protein [Jejuia spongiicola]|uniref:ATP-binding protein n=1 Tax=Jejuia spongiicola TaxID=2942207 RepID=A0ABT0QG46_9FLAO|nr:hypothetical protein [Jejuia spongiicola]MCL6295234.1 hypothetical protein [Jejuia spongiicola]
MDNVKYLIMFCFSILVCCNQAKTKKQKTEKSVEIVLEKLWETDTILKTCEAVRYNPKKNLIYVSNIGNVPPDAKDNDGSISILDESGKVLNQNWVTGISAPKGSDFYKNTLYVTDVNEVVEIDIETGHVNNKHVVQDAVFLNDLSVDLNGDIFFTDSRGDRVLKLVNNKVSPWLDLIGINPNGILVEKERVLVVSYSNGNLISIDKKTKKKDVLATGIVGGDGIVSIKEGYIVSTWQGEIFFVDRHLKNSKAIKILDTKAEKLNAADISIIPEKNILLVPTFFGNSVIAYKINTNYK